MSEKIVSAGVFIQENDQSYLPQGVEQIGAAFIGPFRKGPAFVPTLLTSPNQAIQQFGDTYDKYYTPYALQNWLKNADSAYAIRTLWDEGYTLVNNEILPLNLGTYTAGKFSTGSLTPISAVGPNAKFRVTASGEHYNFLASNGSLVDYSNNYYFITGSTVSASLVNLKDKMNEILTFFRVTNPSSTSIAISSSLPSITYNGAIIASGSTTVTLGGGAAPTNSNLVAVLAPSANENVTNMKVEAGSTIATLHVQITGSKNYLYTCSLDSTQDNYIENIFGTDPQGKKPAYVYVSFPDTIAESATSTTVTKNTQVTMDFEFAAGNQYKTAETPWVTSQILGTEYYNLFKAVSLSDGNCGNKEVKIAISDIKAAGSIPGSDYGTFTLTVRNWDDVDYRPEILETFSGLNLDPESENYIVRVIGDRYPVFSTDSDGNNIVDYDGDYPNKSNYIRIVVEDDVKDGVITPTVVPFGFKSVKNPILITNMPTASFVTAQTYNGETDTRVHFGFDFTTVDNQQYLNALPEGAISGNNIDFNLSNMTDAEGSAITVNSNSKYKKFIIPFQGGFDGTNPAQSIAVGENITSNNIMGFDCSSATASGTTVYRKAIDTIANPLNIDVKMLCIPGITLAKHSSVFNYAVNAVEDRGDCFYLADLDRKGTTVLNAISDVESIDTNYSAVYFPWVKIKDPNTNKYVWVPPSVELAGVFAFNDKVGYEWYAPAGLNRGGLTNVIEPEIRLTRADMNNLSEGRINPIITYPNIGPAVNGQKTLQAKPSALDRINVRRLLINLKKYIASVSAYLTFEQNVASTRDKFLNSVNPYMESVKQKNGLYNFKVVMDETNNTPDVIDRNIMKGDIYIQPSRTAEVILIGFNILPTGASFENI